MNGLMKQEELRGCRYYTGVYRHPEAFAFLSATRARFQAPGFKIRFYKQRPDHDRVIILSLSLVMLLYSIPLFVIRNYC